MKVPNIYTCLVLLAVIVAGCFIYSVQAGKSAGESVMQKAEDFAQDIRGDVKDLGKLVIESLRETDQSGVTMVISGDVSKIEELVLAQQDFVVRYTYQTERFFSTKKIRLEGVFTAKAGVNVKDVTINIDPDAMGTIQGVQGMISSVALKEMAVHDESNGLWNWISDKDRRQAVNALTQEAETEVNKSSLKQKAAEAYIERLQRLAEKNGLELNPAR